MIPQFFQLAEKLLDFIFVFSFIEHQFFELLPLISEGRGTLKN